jgi:hypothetical protein
VLWSAMRPRIALLQAAANKSPVFVPARRTILRKRREDAHATPTSLREAAADRALQSPAIAGRNEIFRALIR